MGEAGVRSGGIAAFFAAATVVLSHPLSMIFSPALAYVVVPIVYTLTVWVLWTTKALFARCGYRSANALLWALIVYPALVVAIGAALHFAGFAARFSEENLTHTFVVMGATMTPLLIWAVLGVVFGVMAVSFGPRAPGPWRAAGVIYIVGWIIFGIGPAWLVFDAVSNLAGEETGSAFSIIGAYWITVLGAGVVTGAWICHGIGLVMGAAKMSQR